MADSSNHKSGIKMKGQTMVLWKLWEQVMNVQQRTLIQGKWYIANIGLTEANHSVTGQVIPSQLIR